MTSYTFVLINSQGDQIRCENGRPSVAVKAAWEQGKEFLEEYVTYEEFILNAGVGLHKAKTFPDISFLITTVHPSHMFEFRWEILE